MTTQPHPPGRRAKPTFVLTDQSRALLLGTTPATDKTKPSRRAPLPTVHARIAVPFMAAVVAAMTLLAVLTLFANRPEPIPTTELAPAAQAADHGQPANPGPAY